MKTSKSRTGFFSFPYVVWMILFVVVPLLIMAYYGFTDQNGNFTWSNILSMAEPIHRKALWTSVRLSVVCTLICILLALPLAAVMHELTHKKQWFCDLYLYSAYVDEFFVKDHRMAVTIGKNRCDQPDHPVVRTAGPEYDQHRGGSSPWHGIQLSAVYGAAGVQCVHEDP